MVLLGADGAKREECGHAGFNSLYREHRHKRFLMPYQANPVQQPFSVGVVKSRPTMEARMIFTVGWLAVLLGLLAMQWADNGGGFSWHS